jgi:hypothetical protein
MSDRCAAWIRTMWPLLLGAFAARILAQSWAVDVVDLLARLGVRVTEVSLTAALSVVAAAAVYGLGGWLERRAGVGRVAVLARAVGRFLISIGLPTGQPTYAGRRVRVLDGGR